MLFTTALRLGKRACSETGIARAKVSISSAAVELARDALWGWSERSALLIAAGRTSQFCARLLRGHTQRPCGYLSPFAVSLLGSHRWCFLRREHVAVFALDPRADSGTRRQITELLDAYVNGVFMRGTEGAVADHESRG